jgi:hypothetical protein
MALLRGNTEPEPDIIYYDGYITSRHKTILYILDPKKTEVNPMSRNIIPVNGETCQVISTAKLHTGYRRTTDEILLLLEGKFL